MKILQINVSVNSGSTGRIAEDIGKVMIDHQFESAIAFGRQERPSSSKKIKIGNILNIYTHILQTRLIDNHGFASTAATHKFIQQIQAYKPDVIGLHNIHGYYLHVGILFDFLKNYGCPVVWTFHDCWPFTGHCSYFDRFNCEKWKTHCFKCPMKKFYPESLFIDRSFKNFEEKKRVFTGHSNLTIVTPSIWLKNLVDDSFLKEYQTRVIHNGIDLELFKPKSEIQDKTKFILGVASVWSLRKGLNDFIKLREILDPNIEIVLIGLNKNQIKSLPNGIGGVERTESVTELANWYASALAFINPTYVDNFPTTNLEALACGTPVITYDTGGSPEAVDEYTGFVLRKGDIHGIKLGIENLLSRDQNELKNACRARAEKLFDKNDRFKDYLNIYKSLLNNE